MLTVRLRAAVLGAALLVGMLLQLYAMVSETLRYKPLLDKLILMADPE